MFEINVAEVRWMLGAACADEDAELFFSVSEVGPGARQVAEAKAVCRACPVRAECLAYALENGLTEGVFGGLSAAERDALVRS